MRHLLLVVGAALAAVLSAQETAAPAATDWDKEVDKACTSARLGLRLAASKKVAEAGDAAVPAIRRFAAKNGANALPVALVEAEADKGGNGEPVVTLLLDWAKDRDFYWRAQATRGLALRSREADTAKRCEGLFARMVTDPAWLVRVHATVGNANAQIALGNFATAFYQRDSDPDPRVDYKVAALNCDFTEIPVLLFALGDERTFLGDPWGRRCALEAITALRTYFGTDCGYNVDASWQANQAAIEQLRELKAKDDTEHRAERRSAFERDLRRLAPHLTDPSEPFAGGIEILSCKNGDYFLRWRTDGEIVFGLEGNSSLRVPANTWRELSKERAPLTLPAQSGVVVCDKLRLKWSEPDLHAAVAPGSLPAPAAEWLKHLAQAIEEAGAKDQAAALRQRLDQFLPR